MNANLNPSPGNPPVSADLEPPASSPEGHPEPRDAPACEALPLLETYGAPLSCRVFTEIGVVLNHLHVRQTRLIARQPTDDLDLLGDLRRMSWPERTGRLNDRAELLLLIALALDISPDARRLLRAVSPVYPYPCLRSIANLTGLRGKELEAFTREIEDDAPLVHFDLIEVQAGPDVRDVPARWFGTPIHPRRACLYVTHEGMNFLLGLPLDQGPDAPADATPSWWVAVTSWWNRWSARLWGEDS